MLMLFGFGSFPVHATVYPLYDFVDIYIYFLWQDEVREDVKKYEEEVEAFQSTYNTIVAKDKVRLHMHYFHLVFLP